MTYVITQRCCNDASCIPECPVDCIRPSPADPDFATTEMLYIDPQTCIDCGACADVCPVSAIYAEDELPDSQLRFAEINAAYFDRYPLEPADSSSAAALSVAGPDKLRVAVVGAGPSACYAAEILLSGGAEVTVLERLPTPHGLVRAGVAPDHQETKRIADIFDAILKRPAVDCYLNVEVGEHITHDELLEHHHAVIYAVGASTDRRLGIAGEDLPGSHSATEFVAWYNGHPDYADRRYDFSGERAVIVGNGNVALDIARILTLSPEELARTDIADHALDALRNSSIREVVVLGRRGPAQAAYSLPEFLALGYLSNTDIVIDPAEAALDPVSRSLFETGDRAPSQRMKVELAQDYSQREHDPDNKRIVFRYTVSPSEICGAARVEALDITHNELVRRGDSVTAEATDERERLETGLVFRSIGYQGKPISGLPFDQANGSTPNEAGRVVDRDGRVCRGAYVTGWVKRGPTGVIGTNKECARETVTNLVEDFAAGRLDAPSAERVALGELIRARQPDVVIAEQWRAIAKSERERGRADGRPRVKFVSVDELLRAAGSAASR